MGIIDRREIEFDARALIGVVAGSVQRAQAIGLPERSSDRPVAARIANQMRLVL